jgi:hypothetical protein
VTGESSTGVRSSEEKGFGVGRLRRGCVVHEAPATAWASKESERERGRALVGRRERSSTCIYREREGRGEGVRRERGGRSVLQDAIDGGNISGERVERGETVALKLHYAEEKNGSGCRAVGRGAAWLAVGRAWCVGRRCGRGVARRWLGRRAAAAARGRGGRGVGPPSGPLGLG